MKNKNVQYKKKKFFVLINCVSGFERLFKIKNKINILSKLIKLKLI